MRPMTGMEMFVAAILGIAALLLPFCRRRAIDRTVNRLGLVLFAVLVGSHAQRWWLGHWTIGPYLTPVEIIAPDGRHYDGSEVNPFARFDCPAFYWGIYAVCGGCIAFDGWHRRRERRLERLGSRRAAGVIHQPRMRRSDR